MIIVNIAKDYTRFPSGRYKRNGSTSGEEFRDRFLKDPISKHVPVTIDFDGTLGYGSSFLEEAFGGLVRSVQVPSDQILSLLTLRSSDDSICEEVRQYIRDAGARVTQHA